MTRILVVEDNPDLAFALTSTLQIEGYEVITARDGPSGVQRATEDDPDLIVLDVMLPGFDGFRVLRSLRSAGIDTPVLMLTAKGEEEDKVRGFRLGADDYVTKPFGAMELLARVNAVLRRTARTSREGKAPPPALEVFGDIEVSRAARTVRRHGVPVQLTPKEFDLLVALLDRQGAAASRNDLLKEVWGYQADVTTRTVDIHIAELRRKLEDDSSHPRHILTVWKVGYRLDPEGVAAAS